MLITGNYSKSSIRLERASRFKTLEFLFRVLRDITKDQQQPRTKYTERIRVKRRRWGSRTHFDNKAEQLSPDWQSKNDQREAVNKKNKIESDDVWKKINRETKSK